MKKSVNYKNQKIDTLVSHGAQGLTIGLDLGDQWAELCALDADGNVVETGCVGPLQADQQGAALPSERTPTDTELSVEKLTEVINPAVLNALVKGRYFHKNSLDPGSLLIEGTMLAQALANL